MSLFLGCSDGSLDELEASDTSNLANTPIQYTECSTFNDGACINPDEEVTLFNTYAYYTKSSDTWTLNIHGWIYEPDYSIVTRNVFVKLIEAVVGTITTEPNFLDERIAPFLVDNEGDEKIIVSMVNETFTLKESESTGLFTGEITLSNEQVKAFSSNNQLTYTLIMPKEDKRVFRGTVSLIEPNGTMIVSDIDDTIKVTEVYLGNTKIIDNTFLQTPKVAQGMQTLYQKLQNENDNTTFHYVSGSPWQLYTFVQDFVTNNTFANGTFHLKELRLNPLSSTLYNFLDTDSTYVHKIDTITQMMKDFPAKQFILIGDSGEKDVEVYGDLYKEYASQIKAIYIRNVTDETQNNARMKSAYGQYASSVILIEP